MAVIETWFEQDLQKAVQVQHLDGSLFSNNANGNRVGVVVYNNGVAASLSGTVSGYAVLPDGTTVPCTGSLSGNRASVLIPAAAYQPGIIFVSVFLTSGSTVTTLAAVAANVQQARTDSQVSPGSAVTDWTQTINAAMQSVVTANAANMAVEYGSLTYPVPVGKYTIYNDLLYRCTTPIATAESWTASHWTRVRIADEVSDLKGAFEYETESNTDFFEDELGITNYIFKYNGNKAIFTDGATIDINNPQLVNNKLWKYCVIPCTEGDKFHVTINFAASTIRPWAFVGADGTKLSVASANNVDVDLTAPANAAYLVCNVRIDETVISPPVYKVTKGTSRIAALEDRTSAAESDINNNTENVALALTSEMHYLKGEFERNAWRTDLPYTKLNKRNWKVRSSDYIVYPHDIELIAKNGYQFYFQTLTDENEFIFDNDWFSHYGYIPANTKFTITILADPEDTTVIADPNVYKMKVQVRKTEPFNLRWKAYMKDRLHFIGHRGWRGDTTNIPENSIPAFQKAGQFGAWAIETDVRETSDGAFVIMHDETVDRTTDGTGKIANMTLAQVQALHLIGGDGTLTVPTFAEYLGQCKIYGCVAFVEIKALNNGLTSFEQVVAMIQKYGMRDYTGFIVHTKEMLDNVRRYFPEVPVQFMTESYTLWPDYADYLNAMQCLGNSVCELLGADSSESISRIPLVHQKGLPAVVSSSSWAAQSTYLRSGVDLIVSNNNLVVGT